MNRKRHPQSTSVPRREDQEEKKGKQKTENLINNTVLIDGVNRNSIHPRAALLHCRRRQVD